MNQVPPSVLADAARLLRAIAEDFSFHAGHNPACDSLHWEKLLTVLCLLSLASVAGAVLTILGGLAWMASALFRRREAR
jgi:hypothetical protein